LSSRAVAALFGFASVVVLAGCYASTEPATDVGAESATLNARGTANNGAASAYFEYWINEGSTAPQQTETAHFPAGANGPFSKKVTGLAAGTPYAYRMCGSDDSGGPTVCAQTREFQTSAPVEDSVTGYWNLHPDVQGTVDAHSGPSGENPRGFLRSRGPAIDWGVFEGNVTCVAVNGRQGAVGAVGRSHPFDQPTNWRPTTMLLTVEDRVTNRSDSGWEILAEGSTPPNCTTASFASQFTISNPGSELIVNDAPASTPTSAR
jgi:hypothetical protein